jgi:hypothetical protein
LQSPFSGLLISDIQASIGKRIENIRPIHRALPDVDLAHGRGPAQGYGLPFDFAKVLWFNENRHRVKRNFQQGQWDRRQYRKKPNFRVALRLEFAAAYYEYASRR